MKIESNNSLYESRCAGDTCAHRVVASKTALYSRQTGTSAGCAKLVLGSSDGVATGVPGAPPPGPPPRLTVVASTVSFLAAMAKTMPSAMSARKASDSTVAAVFQASGWFGAMPSPSPIGSAIGANAAITWVEVRYVPSDQFSSVAFDSRDTIAGGAMQSSEVTCSPCWTFQ